MKQSFTGIISCLAVTAALLFSSCKKGDDGAVGATGPAGAPGAPGAAGPAGTANVIYSPWLNVDFNTIQTPAGDTLRFVANVPAPRLVDSILAKGEIKVYFNYGTPAEPNVVPLPYFDPIYFTPPVVLNAEYGKGLIILTSNYNMGTFDEEGEKRFQYRYILIPGGTAGRPVEGSAVNWEDYQSVRRYLGLRD